MDVNQSLWQKRVLIWSLLHLLCLTVKNPLTTSLSPITRWSFNWIYVVCLGSCDSIRGQDGDACSVVEYSRIVVYSRSCAKCLTNETEWWIGSVPEPLRHLVSQEIVLEAQLGSGRLSWSHCSPHAVYFSKTQCIILNIWSFIKECSNPLKKAIHGGFWRLHNSKGIKDIAAR